MGIIKCSKCGKEVSDTCMYCAHCGILLKSTLSPEGTSEKMKKTTNFSTMISKFKIPIIAVLGIIILVTIVLVYSSNKNRDPFEKIYIGQTRESVHAVLGTPTRSENLDVNDYLSDNNDEYHNVKLKKITGILKIQYDSKNYVVEVVFDYDYPSRAQDPKAVPSSKERDEARMCALEIKEFYTDKYGTPESDEDFDYHVWYLADGKKMVLDFNPEPKEDEHAIRISLRTW